MPRIRHTEQSPVHALIEAARDRAAATTPEEKRQAEFAYEIASMRYHADRRAREVCATTAKKCSTTSTTDALKTELRARRGYRRAITDLADAESELHMTIAEESAAVSTTDAPTLQTKRVEPLAASEPANSESTTHETSKASASSTPADPRSSAAPRETRTNVHASRSAKGIRNSSRRASGKA